MNTKTEFNCDFFENASMLWKQNKKYLGNGVYTYLCEGVFKNGRCCLRKACKESLMDVLAPKRLCKLHYQSYQKDLINNEKTKETIHNKECKKNMRTCGKYELRKKNNIKRKIDDLYNYDDFNNE